MSTSPRIKTADAIARLLERAAAVLGAGRTIHPSRLRAVDAQAQRRGRQIRALAKGRDLYEGRKAAA